MSLLPNNETKSWQLYDKWVKGRLDRIKIIHNPLNPLNAPVHLLPYIAQEYDTDVSMYTEAKQREILSRGIYIKSKIGTVAAVKEVLHSFDPDAKLESLSMMNSLRLDGSCKLDGSHRWADNRFAHWAQYSVKLSRSLSDTAAQKLIEGLNEVAPARCELIDFIYQPCLTYDGSCKLDGTYFYGGIIE